jgi:tetratricopeptide (TPR) repeat protein
MSAAAELAPNDPLYWERLAIYHARLNRDEMACEFMRKSIALHQNPHSYRFLSETLSRMGQHGEAVEALTRAVQIAAGTPMAAEWQRQLDGLKTEAGSVP